MPSTTHGPFIEVRTGVTGGDESKPSGNAAGIDFGPDGGDWTEIGFFLGAASESDVANVQFWYYNAELDDWGKGRAPTDTLAITGSTVALAFTVGGRVDVQLTSITGTFSVWARPIKKRA